MRISFLLTYFACISFLSSVWSAIVNSNAISTRSKAVAIKAAFAVSAAGLLYIAKKGPIDGPLFVEDIDLSDKTCVITGGNTGLGKETAIKLASLGAEVIILCKTPERAEAAVVDIINQASSKEFNNRIKLQSKPRVSWLPLDLANLKSIAQASEKLKQSVDKIDILVNNAGVMAIPTRQVTQDGFEEHLGINHLGHYALTLSLLPLLRKAKKDARIVTVSSAAHVIGSFKDRRSEVEYMFSKEGSYGPWEAYGDSKLANILFTRSLQQILSQSSNPSDRKIIPLTCHPGGCRTELGRYIIDFNNLSLPAKVAGGLLAPPLFYFTKDARMGAQTQIYLSASSNIDGKDAGLYFDNSRVAKTTDEASDMGTAQWLWKESERLTGVSFPS